MVDATASFHTAVENLRASNRVVIAASVPPAPDGGIEETRTFNAAATGIAKEIHIVSEKLARLNKCETSPHCVTNSRVTNYGRHQKAKFIQ
jgi:hypothetical protein